ANAAIASAGKAMTPQQQRDLAFDAAATAARGHPLFQVSSEVQRVLDVNPAEILGRTASGLSSEPAEAPVHAPVSNPGRGPAPEPGPGRGPGQEGPQPEPSQDPVIRQAGEKAARLGQIAQGWSRAAQVAGQTAKAVGKWV